MRRNGLPRNKAYSLVAPTNDLPELMTRCPLCGGEIGLWPQEEETVCVFCEYKLFERENTTH